MPQTNEWYSVINYSANTFFILHKELSSEFHRRIQDSEVLSFCVNVGDIVLQIMSSSER